MKIKDRFKQYEKSDIVACFSFCLTSLLSFIDIARYAALGESTAFLVMLSLNVSLVLLAGAGWLARLSALFVADGIAYGILAFNTNLFGMPLFNFVFFLQAAVCAIGGVFATVLQIRDGKLPRKRGYPALSAFIIVCLFWGLFCFGQISAAERRAFVQSEIWAVPDRYDNADCPQKGTLERVSYSTKAYATDKRDVVKSALVYLPYGYTEETEYNILYLMHGTGDDETYWLERYGYNKTMIDNLIYYGEIDPLIVVTPTFYTEDDCSDNLDELTYSFKEELRNDLMPLIESRYSTYAQSCTPEGFAESRDHRAFAGLSRGAVTMLHSALCGSLDYFSWFGAFSGSRTDADYLTQTLQSESFQDYSINYLYASSGSFDFPLSGQLNDYRSWLEAESRLKQSVNTCFEVFPLQKHAIGCWHLALYNFLQKIF